MTTPRKISNNALSNRVALVSGASSGIGEATALSLARAGAKVVVSGRRENRLDSLVERIGAEGGVALAVRTDVSRRDEAENAVARAIETFGRLDILVNSAGRASLKPAAESDPSEWNEMIGVNLQGVLYMVHAALPHLVAAAKSGPSGIADIVNISSVAARVVRKNYAGYSMTKAGLNAFTESLRAELATQSVRASVIEPGAVDTEFASQISSSSRATMQNLIGGFEWLKAMDIADAVSYVVTRPRHVAVNELLIRPTGQSG